MKKILYVTTLSLLFSSYTNSVIDLNIYEALRSGDHHTIAEYLQDGFMNKSEKDDLLKEVNELLKDAEVRSKKINKKKIAAGMLSFITSIASLVKNITSCLQVVEEISRDRKCSSDEENNEVKTQHNHDSLFKPLEQPKPNSNTPKEKVKRNLKDYIKGINKKQLGFSTTCGVAGYYLVKNGLSNSNIKKQIVKLQTIKEMIEEAETLDS